MELLWTKHLHPELQEKIKQVQTQIAPKIAEIDARATYNQQRVLQLFKKHHVAEEDLVGSTGYGYTDTARDKLDAIYADYFKADDAIVRPQICSGTHAITTALMGQLRPGDTLYYLTGMPYDTIQQVIGVAGSNPGTMKEWGIDFKYTPLLADGSVDFKQAEQELTANSKIKVVAIQRSRGYASRPSFTVAQIKEMIDFVRKYAPNAVIFVDNCYGEFSETEEPTFFGADIMAGSLYKNAGAGLAKTGGYIVGSQKCIDNAAARLTVPGAGKHEGATYGFMRDFIQGFFMAPHTTGEAIKGAIFASALCEAMGMDVDPKWNDPRTDLVQTITFGKREPMIAFCKEIQHNSPLNAFVDPIPSYMDGYEDEIIMADGAFIEGATIELSCDGPLRAPYSLYLQGGLTYNHVQIAVANALEATFFAD